MGLNFSHGDASWAYGGFHRFRIRLAEAIGIDLEKMIGFNQKYVGDGKYVKTTENPLNWNTVKDDIKLLLNHSDCDGVLTPENCRKVAFRLRELVRNWKDTDYDKINALELAEGMEEAAENDEIFEFL